MGIKHGKLKEVQGSTKLIFGAICAEERIIKVKFVGMIRKKMPF
jgi:hypothetical protein